MSQHIATRLLNTRNMLRPTLVRYVALSCGDRVAGASHFFEELAQAAQTLFVIYIRDSIALRFEPFKRMYENGSKIALNSTCSKGFK